MKILALLPLVVVVLLGQRVEAYASDELCSGWASWMPGTLYDQMNIDDFGTDAMACVASIEPNVRTYLPGQEFTLHIVPSSPMGIKAVLLGGAEFRTKSHGGDITANDCVNYDLRTKSAQMTFKAPTMGGNITIKSLCGKLDEMNVGNDIVLQPSVGVPPLPAEVSTDPRYKFQRTLHKEFPSVVMHYNRNATHLDVSVEYNTHGYISIGVGREMIPSLVLIGANPQANPKMPSSVGLYKLLRKKKGGLNEMIPGKLENTAGVVSASFTELGTGKSELKFSQLLSKQVKGFSFAALEHDDPITDIIWAVGPHKYAKHTACGTVLDMKFTSSVVLSTAMPTQPPTTTTTEPTQQPTTTSPTASPTNAPTVGKGSQSKDKDDGNVSIFADFIIFLTILLFLYCFSVLIKKRMLPRHHHGVADGGIDFAYSNQHEQQAAQDVEIPGVTTQQQLQQSSAADALDTALLNENQRSNNTEGDSVHII